MNYLYLTLIPLILIISGLICYFACFSEKFYDPDKIPSKITDDEKDLEQKEEKQPEQKQKTLEKIKTEPEQTKNIKSMLLSLAKSLKKHPTKEFQSIIDEFSKLETEQKHQVLNHRVSLLGMFFLLGNYCLLTDEDENLSKYLKFVEDLIEGTEALLNNINSNDSQIPNIENWYTTSVSLIRMLATYEIIGSDDTIKDICHKRILQITPKVNIWYNVKKTGIEVVSIAVPHLITTILFAKDNYDNEISTNCDDLKAFMQNGTNVDNRSPKDFADGFYQDGSFLYNKVATYEPLIDLQTFYIEILKVLEFDTRIKDRVKDICNSILHPDMDFVPLNLFVRDPTVTYQQAIVQYWPEFVKKADYNSQIFPVIGLGVFKSPDFFFSVRVQRDGIAAFESSDEIYEFALGWIQIRKLFIKEVNYDFNNKMTFLQLKKQPGVISLVKTDDLIPEMPHNQTNFKRHFVKVKNSYVGHFTIKDKGSVLYWMQTYTFSFCKNDTSITECGVCTNNGLVMRHELSHQCNEPLRFQVNDQDINGQLKTKFSSNGLNLTDGAFLIEKNQPTVIFSNYVKDEKVQPQEISYDNTENSMKFKFDAKTFVVKSDADFNVVIEEKEPLIASGYPIWENTYNYNYNGEQLTFIYNPESKMFQKQGKKS